MLWLLRKRFLNNFLKIYPLCCHGNQSNSAIWTKFIWIVEDYLRNISVEKNLNICSETAKIATFHFSHYKSMETISSHSSQSSYPTGTKNWYSAIIFWEIRNRWLVWTHILDRFLFIWTPFWFISVFESTAYLKFAKLPYVSSGFRCRVIAGSLMGLY